MVHCTCLHLPVNLVGHLMEGDRQTALLEIFIAIVQEIGDPGAYLAHDSLLAPE